MFPIRLMVCGALLVHLMGTPLVLPAASAPVSRVGSVRTEDLPDDLAACLDLARQSNSAHALAHQRDVLEHAEALSDGRPEDRAEVQRQLAVLDWKYELRDEAARDRLNRATEGPEAAKAWLALARLEMARERHAEARTAAEEAERVAKRKETRRKARLVRARAAISRAGASRRQGASGLSKELREAYMLALENVQAEPGLLDPAKLLLRSSILLADGQSALLAWHSYYHVTGDTPPQELPNGVAEAGAALRGLLPRLGTPALTTDEHIELVDLLRRTHFHEAAAWLALDPALDPAAAKDPRCRDAVAYANFVRDLRESVNEHYRELAIRRVNRRSTGRLNREVVSATRKLYRAVEPGKQLPSGSEERWSWLLERFGTLGSLGFTAGFYDLHMGHVVIDQTRPVTQYDQTADFRFVALDHIISNGFQSWAWETGAAHGGWAEVDTMIQVRPAYTDGAINAWRQLHDEEAYAEFLEEIERETARDDERATENPVAFLPGLRSRLQLQAAEALKARLRESGLTEDELRLGFIQEATRSVIEHSIFAHEGRHAIDKRLGIEGTPTLEYRAKLSQMAFAEHPRLAIGSILSPNIGNKSPHGQANERALRGVLKWMKKHADEIEELDLDRPLLPQLDRLTDDQLRACFRSMDPLAK